MSTDKKPSLTELMDMAQKMQKSMRDVQETLEKKEFKGSAGAGMVEVIMNGRKRVVRTIITEQAYKEGIDVLQDLVTAAANSAGESVDRFSETELKKLTQNMGLPPNMDDLPK